VGLLWLYFWFSNLLLTHMDFLIYSLPTLNKTESWTNSLQ
jgi:hypothetical protein